MRQPDVIRKALGRIRTCNRLQTGEPHFRLCFKGAGLRFIIRGSIGVATYQHLLLAQLQHARVQLGGVAGPMPHAGPVRCLLAFHERSVLELDACQTAFRWYPRTIGIAQPPA